MARLIMFRILQFPLILAVIYLLTFTLIWAVPGSPFDRPGRKLPDDVRAALEHRFHADHWYTFLAYYPRRFVVGDLGPSLAHDGWSVSQIIGTTLPVSIALGLVALTTATIVGVGIGVTAAVRRGGLLDWAGLAVVLVGISIPGFVVASLLTLFCAASGRWFPVGEWGRPQDLILPGLALSLMPMAYIARLTRVSMIDVLSSDFVRTARAKGLSRSSVIWKHALRNALLPVLSFLGPAAAATLTGSFVVEKVFNIPGLGLHFINSVLDHDDTLVLGTVIVYSMFLLALNLLVDLSYAFVDPRIDLTAEAS